MFVTQSNHRGDLIIGQHHHTAALADPVQRHIQFSRLFDYRTHGFWTLNGGNFYTPSATIWKSAVGSWRRLRALQPE
jgi:hypothetical protein